MTKAPKPLPCPFCGGDDIRAETTVTDGSVWCCCCGAKIVRTHTLDGDTGISEAIAAWNRRVPAPEVQRLIDEAVEKATRVKPLRYFYPQGDTFGQMRDNARQHPLAKEGDMKLVWVNAGDLWNIVIRATIGGDDE